jgi:hypothetical protein
VSHQHPAIFFSFFFIHLIFVCVCDREREWGLSSGLLIHKAGVLLLEPHLQSIFLWLFGDGVSRTICPGWPGTVILLISASQVTRVTDVSRWCLAWLHFLAIAVAVRGQLCSGGSVEFQDPGSAAMPCSALGW